MSNRIGIGIDVFGAGIDADAQTIYNRIIADGGVSNLTRLNFFVKGLKTIYGDLANVPVCYDAHWIGYKLGSGTGTTAGQAAAKLYSLTVAGDAAQATAASQPLLLSHNGASSDNYWYGSGIANNYVSTPNASANQITGDIEFIVKAQSTLTFAVQTIILKGTTGNYNYAVDISNANNLRLVINGLNIYSSTVTINPMTLQFIKVTRTSSNGDIKFFTSLNGVTYTQLGTTVSSPSGLITNNNHPLIIGANTAYVGNDFQGKIYNVTISNSIGGTPVVDFNPATYNASTSQTQWTSTTGEVWTINTGTAATGYKGVLVDRTIVQTDGVDDTLVMPSNVGLTAPITLYTSFRGYSDDGGTGKSIFGYSNIDVAITRYNFSNVVAWFGNGGASNKQFTLGGISDKILMAMAIRRNGTCELSVNNATPVTGTQATAITDGRIGVSVSGFSNATFRTGVVIIGADNSTNQTATYNLIRSLNNNSF
jgi:hypothetical protein